MSTFSTPQQRQAQQKSSGPEPPGAAAAERSGEESHALRLQHAIGNQAVLRLLRARPDASGTTHTPSRAAHHPGRTHVRQQAPRGAQAKLQVSTPGDIFEQEADSVAEHVMRTAGAHANPAEGEDIHSHGRQLQRACACDASTDGAGQCAECAARAGELVQRKCEANAPARAVSRLTPASPGRPLDQPTRAFMESRFGHRFGDVRVHADAPASRAARSVNARAYTVGRDIVFGAGQYRPETDAGKRLLAHELTHVIQQGAAASLRSEGDADLLSPRPEAAPAVQRDDDEAAPEAARPQFDDPLTDSEWRMLEMWLARGEVGIDPLTGDAAHNALVVAEAIFCGRALYHLVTSNNEDPLLCVISDVTRADPRVQALVPLVTARGPIINWAAVSTNNRLLHVMERLVDEYQYPVNGAAGLVGNLFAESGVLPSRIEGSSSATPMTAPNFAGQSTAFTSEEVMNRDASARQGPRLPGIGLAQWTSPARRTGLFQHQYGARPAGSGILFDMDAQIDYLDTELQGQYPGVHTVITAAGVSVDDASDEVVYRFEVPGAILAPGGGLLPRTDPAVQEVFRARRALSQRALRVYREAHP